MAAAKRSSTVRRVPSFLQAHTVRTFLNLVPPAEGSFHVLTSEVDVVAQPVRRTAARTQCLSSMEQLPFVYSVGCRVISPSVPWAHRGFRAIALWCGHLPEEPEEPAEPGVESCMYL